MADSRMFAKSAGEWIPVFPDPPRGVAPALSAVPAATQIVYTWTAASGLTIASYEFEFNGVIENVGNVLTVTKTGLTTGSSHTARVRAKSNENVRGPWSNLLTTTAALPFNVASGGSVVDVPNYNGTGETWRVHTFTDSADFVVTEAPQPFRVLVVGGGGGSTGNCGTAGETRCGAAGPGGAVQYWAARTIAPGTYGAAIGGGGGPGGNIIDGKQPTSGGTTTFIGEASGGSGGTGPTHDISGTPTVYGQAGNPNVRGGGAGAACAGNWCEGGWAGTAGVVIVAYRVG